MDVRVKAGHKTFFTTSDIEDVLEQMHDQYGRWQDRECQDLKSKLLALEDRSIGLNGSGRVRMTDFYGSAVKDGNWQFRERIEFLERLGVMDMRDPKVPRMIIPNYIISPSNCLAGSKYYSVCCINECEDLLDKIQHHFKAPVAYPSNLAAAISSLASSTVPASRSLQPILVSRLEEIAKHHGGVVPLHGRLFMQWMHHAYPRECPYPHLAGTTKPQRTREYIKEFNRSATHKKEDLAQEIQELEALMASEEGAASPIDSDECTEWSAAEELYVSGALAAYQKDRPFRRVAYVAIVLAFGGLAVRRMQSYAAETYHGATRKDIMV